MQTLLHTARSVQSLALFSSHSTAKSASTWRLLSTMANKVHINVQITSDVVCPWCWIGKRSLDTAMEHLKDDFEFHINWKPFLLNPNMPDTGMPLRDYCIMKFGPETGLRFLSDSSPVAQRGRELGINFNQNRLIVGTRKAHILLDYAGKEGKQHKMQEVLFRAYFSDGVNIAENNVLRGLAAEVGLNTDKAIAALSDTEYYKEFHKSVEEAYEKGITGVPYFEISVPDKPGISQSFSGGQPTNTFVQVFSRIKSLSKV